jgi:hypothetical protein
MKEELWVLLMWILVDVIDTGSVKCGRATNKAMYFISLSEQELCKV